MMDLFYMGGAAFMSILTLILIVVVAWGIYHFIAGLNAKGEKYDVVIHRLSYIKSLGFFGMITGILGQFIGMYNAFAAIEQAEDISKTLFFGGVKVSLITPIYGILIFLISLLLWFVLDYMLGKKQES